MAQRGAKPKPASLRLVDGTHNVTRHGSEAKAKAAVEAAAAAFDGLKKPAYMKGEAAKAWARYVAPAWWLKADREPLAVAFCELWQEFREHPQRFPASKHGQLRSYMAELGLSDVRTRGLPSPHGRPCAGPRTRADVQS